MLERKKPNLSLAETIGNLNDFARSGESQIFWIREIGFFAINGNVAAENFLRKRFLEKIDNCDIEIELVIFQIFCEIKEPLSETVESMQKYIQAMKKRRVARQQQFGKSC